jgi:type VI secretion system protein ImpF
MADLTPKERLQPSLLDRLTDDEPDNVVESREQRVLSIERLHECVIRDLSWLLNAENLATVCDLSEYPDAAASTLNYGILSLSGQMVSRRDRRRLEESIRESILRFEPRLLAKTVRVRALMGDYDMQPNSLSFEIEATVWAQPLPLELLVTADVDLETGNFNVARR